MKFCFPLFVVFFLSGSPLQAQAALHSKTFERLEGTVALEANGVTSRAQVQFQAPNQWRADITGTPNPNTPNAKTVIVAIGDETRSLDATSQRVRRLPYNITRQVWRGAGLEFGGAANVVLFGTNEKDLATTYQRTQSPTNTQTFQARKDIGRFLVRDWVRTGGIGDDMFYVAHKRPVFDRPAQITLLFDATTKHLVTRRDQDEQGRILNETTFTYDATSLPRTAVVRDANKAVMATFTYDLKVRAEAFPDGTFALPQAEGQVIEDEELRAIGEYTSQDASSHFNRGVALATHSEELPAAFKAWEEALNRAPRAVAPALATFDAALVARDLARASLMLNILSKFQYDPFDLAMRRASLATARREWGEAEKALEAAQALQPSNLSVKLTRATLRRVRGDFDKAQEWLLEIVASSEVNSATINAAQALATIIAEDQRAPFAAALPQATIAQKLTRALLELQTTPENKTLALPDWPVPALVALALEQETAGQEEAALAIWTKLRDSGPHEVSINARLRLMAIQARRGLVKESLAEFQTLWGWTSGEQERLELEDAFLNAWNKGGTLDALKVVLQQRARSSGATSDDWRLWLAYQQSYGDAAAIELQSALRRYPNSAWWNSQLAESKIQEMEAVPFGNQRRDLQQLRLNEALRAAEAAVAADSAQPYYQIQRSLIHTQNYVLTQKGAIVASKASAARNIASEALDKLLATFPDDPDVEIAVALQRMMLSKTAEAQVEPVRLLQKALRGGLPGRDGANRHATVFPARQMIANALRQAGNTDEAIAQFETALLSARNSGEANGIAVNLMNLLLRRKPAALPGFLVRLAHEPWPFTEAQQLMDSLLNILSRDPALSVTLVQALQADPDPYAKIVRVQFLEKITDRARARAAADTSAQSVQLDAEATSAARQWNAAFDELTPLIQSPDAILAARAAALLGERAANATKFEDAVTHFESAVAREPQDLNLRLALAKASLGARQNGAALQALQTLLRALPVNYDTLKQAALLDLQLGRNAQAARLLMTARNQALNTLGGTAYQANAASFLAARALVAAGDTTQALELYNALAGPGRANLERAAALRDAEMRLRQSGKPGSEREADRLLERLRQLNLPPEAFATIDQYLMGLQS